ncbi:MAG: leucine-rich repeat domain-containing protein [Bacteroidaceae bacterium]|nr:leucine-rich repeat domain-containing protein [Bacteroidaceae bacterium]
MIPQGVTTLGIEAFVRCEALTAIEIPSSVTSIGEYAFQVCTGLTRVDSKVPAEKLFTISSNVFEHVDMSTCTLYVPIGAKSKYAATAGWNVFTNIVKDVPENARQCGDDAYWLYDDQTKTLTIFGVGSTCDYDYGKSPWYTNNNVANVVIQDGITGLGKYTFQFYNGLRSVTMSNSVTSIGYGAFVDCTNLTRIEFSNNLTTIGENAFNNCIALEGVVIPSSVTSITENTFYNCRSLGSIVVAEGNTVYDSRNDCNAIIKSADNALVVGSNNTVIPDGITSIGNYAFGGRQELTDIDIPRRVTSIGAQAFYDCDGLTSIEIPAGVTSIGSEAFYDCDGLTSVKSLIPVDNLFEIPTNVFNGVNVACTLYVPFGAKEAYAQKQGWNYFTNVDVWLPFENITITIGDYGSTTYCCEYPLDFSNVVGLKAYAATGYNTATQVVTLVRLNTAKEGTGLFIKGEPGEYTVPVIKQSNDYTLNMLVGTVNEITVNSTTEDGAYANFKYTILSGDETPMFYRFEDNTSLPAHKAYLQLPAALFPSSASKSVSLRFDDGETTDIDEVEGEVADVETVYDLQGRVVENPAKGIYIVDGKKVFINK